MKKLSLILIFVSISLFSFGQSNIGSSFKEVEKMLISKGFKSFSSYEYISSRGSIPGYLVPNDKKDIIAVNNDYFIQFFFNDDGLCKSINFCPKNNKTFQELKNIYDKDWIKVSDNIWKRTNSNDIEVLSELIFDKDNNAIFHITSNL